MSIQICTNNGINLDNQRVELPYKDENGYKIGLFVTQRKDGTVVYSAGFMGKTYKEHPMPHVRYSLTHEAPHSGAAGLTQFEVDIRALLAEMQP